MNLRHYLRSHLDTQFILQGMLVDHLRVSSHFSAYLDAEIDVVDDKIIMFRQHNGNRMYAFHVAREYEKETA
jgi:membrane protease subunit (stomatin/prohibitin family)